MNLQESIRKDLDAFNDNVVTEEHIEEEFEVKVTSSHTGYVTVTAEDEEDAIYNVEANGSAIATHYDPEGTVTAEIVNGKGINEADEEADYDQNDQRIMQMLSNFRTLYKEMKTLDSSGYALDEYKERELRDLYHDLITNWFSIRSGKREGIPDLDGSNYNHPMD
jgi:hypothetical protein